MQMLHLFLKKYLGTFLNLIQYTFQQLIRTCAKKVLPFNSVELSTFQLKLKQKVFTFPKLLAKSCWWLMITFSLSVVLINDLGNCVIIDVFSPPVHFV